jgi:hypothetical protein
VVEDLKGKLREMDKGESKGKDSETQSTEGETEPESGPRWKGASMNQRKSKSAWKK